MALMHNARSIVTDGLILCLDAANTKSYDNNENLLAYSEQFDTGTWTKSTVTLTPNVTTAPDGTLTADLMTEDTGTNSPHWTFYSTAPYTSNTYTFSIFAKQGVGSRYLRFTGFGLSAASENAIFDISSGIVYSPPTTTIFKSASIIPYPNGWYRCICNIQYSGAGQRPFFGLINSTTNFGTYGYTGDGTSGIYIWGAQLEIGSTASPYYVTEATTKSRQTTWNDLSGGGNNLTLTNGPTYSYDNRGFLTFDGVNDHASRNLSSSIISNPSLNNMNISVNFWCNVTSSSSYYILSSGAQTSSTGVAFSYQNGNPFYVIRGTNTESFLYFDVSNFPLNTWINWCFTSNGTSFILYKNGSQIRSDGFSAGTFSTVYDIISIGKPNNADNNYSAMKFSNLAIYKKTLSAAEVSQNFEAIRGRYGI